MAKKKKVDDERVRELADIRTLMNTTEGSRFILRLVNFTGPYRSSFNTEALTMAFLEGQRNVGNLLISELLEACPEQYVRLITEAKINQAAKEAKDAVHKVEPDQESVE